MRNDYIFSKSVKNPHIKKLKKQATVRIDEDTIAVSKSYKSLSKNYVQSCKAFKMEWQ